MVFKSFRDGEAFLKLAYLRDDEAFFKDSSLEMDTWSSSSHHLWRFFTETVQHFSKIYLRRW